VGYSFKYVSNPSSPQSTSKVNSKHRLTRTSPQGLLKWLSAYSSHALLPVWEWLVLAFGEDELIVYAKEKQIWRH
jgi:hypothetical protein